MAFNLCAVCGNETVEEITVPLVVEHSGKSKTIQDRRMRCSSCENLSYQGSQISDHENAVAAAERELAGLLSPEDLCRIRLKYKFKQSEMEQILSTGPKTWTRWERGKVPHSKAADKLIRVMAEYPDIARKLMEQAGVINPEATAVFEQSDQDAKRIARATLRAELSAEAIISTDVINVFVDRFSDQVFERMRSAREQANSKDEAA
jgi:putative zinc finger/helix-turn-helix YgiT family protein